MKKKRIRKVIVENKVCEDVREVNKRECSRNDEKKKREND
jgi:hypothetical protein